MVSKEFICGLYLSNLSYNSYIKNTTKHCKTIKINTGQQVVFKSNSEIN